MLDQIVTIRPDRETPPGPPTALPVVEGEPLEPIPVWQDRQGDLTSRFRLLTKTVRMYLHDAGERRRLAKREAKGWWIGPPEEDYLRPTTPDRINVFHVEPQEKRAHELSRRVVTKISMHPW